MGHMIKKDVHYMSNCNTSPGIRLLQCILNTRERGIFALEYTETREVKLVCSVDIPTAILRESKELRRRKIFSGVTVRILEVTADPDLLGYHWTSYRNNGWKIVNTKRPPRYSVKKRVQLFGNGLKFFVLVKSGGNLYTTCGIFDNEVEADEFIAYLEFGIPKSDDIETELAERYIRPCCARNSLTRKFFSES